MRLKVAITSDTHYGASQKTHRVHEKFWTDLASLSPDILLWAGDLISHKQESLEETVAMARKYLKNTKIFIVRGNHCFWSSEWDSLVGQRTAGISVQSVYKERRERKIVSPLGWSDLLTSHKKVFEKYDVIHLDGEVFDVNEKLTILGFDGWYNHTNVYTLGTNDYRFLPESIENVPVHVYLRDKAEKDLVKILNTNTEGKVVIGMTHFPPFSTEKPVQDASVIEKWGANPTFLDFLAEKCNYLVVGHNHKKLDTVYKNCRILNSGSDYDSPKFLMIEIEL